MGATGYFAGDSALDSFCGVLDPAFELTYGFSEANIIDFIRAARPDLYKDLSHLPLPSSYVHDTETASDDGHPSPTQQERTKPGKLFVAYQRLTTETSSSISETATFMRPEDRRMLDLQHNRFVQCKVLNGYHLILQKHPHLPLDLRCADPRCETVKLLPGTFFTTLSKGYHDVKYHYCLNCLETLFDSTVSFRLVCGLDGCVNGKSTPKFPFHYPSNSPEARLLRDVREQECQLTLQLDHLRQKETRIKDSTDTCDDEATNLVLRRPQDISTYLNRYKKQGRMWDKRTKRKMSNTSGKPDNSSAQRSRFEKAKVNQSADLICFCRELPDGTALVKCCSNGCMIGTFHLRCLKLEEELEEGDKVYCMHCAETLQAGEKEDVGEDESDSPASEEHGLETEMPCATPFDDHLNQPATVRFAEPDSSPVPKEGSTYSPDRYSFTAIKSPGGTAMRRTSYAQIDGLRSPEPPKTCLRHVPAASMSRHEVKVTRNDLPLQPHSARMTFKDLAAYIICELQNHSPFGLSRPEARAVGNWKRLCPKSKLLRVPAPSNHCATEEGVAANGTNSAHTTRWRVNVDGKVVAPGACKLSELLEFVRTD